MQDIQKNRSAYWREVAKSLAVNYEIKRQGGPLDWETIEVLCENHGFRRNNVPKPVHMTDVAARLFTPVEH